jgi:DNA-binding transcriptional MerR regulator/methylmalonyl-CoA mutase cobalamin-binding subunit
MTNNAYGLYPIGKVSEMTGVNAITLRAWERRYDLIRPTRTQKGHRLYTTEDVERIDGILQLMEKGIPISRVSDVLDSNIMINPPADKEPSNSWDSYRASLMDAIIHFDDTKLETIYNEVLSLYPHHLMTRRLLMPLLKELGERWKLTQFGVAEEHFFSVYLRNKLGARLHHRNMENNGPKLILACLPGEHHEIGLLLFALAASDRGFKPLLFGADMPITELVAVTKQTDIDAIIVSSSIDPDPREETLNDLLPNLVEASNCPVFAGGNISTHLEKRLHSMGIKTLGDDIVKGIKLLQEHLRRKPHSKGESFNV